MKIFSRREGLRGIHVFAMLVGIVCLAIVGCGPSDWGYVEGVVKLNGEPVGPGTLIFTPNDSGNTTSAIAHFGEDGRYTVMRPGEKPGAPIGEYRIRVEAGGEGTFGEENAGSPTQPVIPRQYLGYGANLTANIQPGDNKIDFELSQQKPAS